MDDRVPMTPAGHDSLKAELEHLKNVERRQVIKDIEEARAHGDLSENAEYHAAKERQGFVEGRIQEIQFKLGNAQVVDPTALDQNGRIAFGATVKLLDVNTDEEVVYQIVGEDESDTKKGKISFKSPVARALIGKEEADEIRVRTPGGIREMEVLEVRFR